MELRTHGPLFMLDGAFSALRTGGTRLAGRAILGALPLSLAVLALDYFEQVEGVRGLRAPFAAAIVLAFFARSVALSRVSRGYAQALRPTLPVVTPPPSALQVASTAGIVGFGLLGWSALMLLVARAEPLAVIAVWPFAALRGAVAPSWLARASCAPERGTAAYGQAFDDGAGMRGVLLTVELLLQLGALALFGNLYALVGFVLSFGHAMLGLELALLSAFTSPSNAWTLLVMASATMLLLEPLRAAISAHAFVEARTRRDGADLHEAVDAAIESSGKRPRGPVAAWVALLALGGLLGAAGVRAQAAEGAPEVQPAEQDAHDREVRARVARILAGDEFMEHTAGEGALERWLEKLAAWLRTLEPDPSERSGDAVPSDRGGAVPVWAWMSMVAVGLLVLGALLRARGPLRDGAQAGDVAGDGDAAGATSAAAVDALLVAGDPRASLRALYLATLSALDRAGRLELDPSKTNGQHLRALPRGTARAAFTELTVVFDRVFYGHQPLADGELMRCRDLAAVVLVRSPEAGSAPGAPP